MVFSTGLTGMGILQLGAKRLSALFHRENERTARGTNEVTFHCIWHSGCLHVTAIHVTRFRSSQGEQWYVNAPRQRDKTENRANTACAPLPVLFWFRSECPRRSCVLCRRTVGAHDDARENGVGERAMTEEDYAKQDFVGWALFKALRAEQQHALDTAGYNDDDHDD